MIHHQAAYLSWLNIGELAKNEVVLDAVCKEALYLYPLDVENVSAFSVLRKAKSAIEIQIMNLSKSQLTAFKRLLNAV